MWQLVSHFKKSTCTLLTLDGKFSKKVFGSLLLFWAAEPSTGQPHPHTAFTAGYPIPSRHSILTLCIANTAYCPGHTKHKQNARLDYQSLHKKKEIRGLRFNCSTFKTKQMQLGPYSSSSMEGDSLLSRLLKMTLSVTDSGTTKLWRRTSMIKPTGYRTPTGGTCFHST